MPQNPETVLNALASSHGWTTSSELSEKLGISDRTVRIHVAAARSVSAPFRVIESSSRGYRLNRAEYAAYLASRGPADVISPRQDRLRAIIRALSSAPAGLSIDSFAGALFVSESTIEADIRKLRLIAANTGVTVGRKGNVVTLSGSWPSRRRLLSEVFRADGAVGYLEHQTAEMNTAAARLRSFKTGVIRWIEKSGRGVNEYGIASVMLHLAIAVDRADHVSDSSGTTEMSAWTEQETRIAELVRDSFHVELVPEDLRYLSGLLETRATTRMEHDLDILPDAAVLAMTRRILASVSETHAVSIGDPQMECRLARHIESLLDRVRARNATRNPLIQSIKFSHPFVFDVAVDIARQIEDEQQVSIVEDEISFIALHLGLTVSPQLREQTRITVALVCPSYYEMADVVKQRIEAEFGNDISITSLISRTDVEAGDLGEDMVISTILSPGAGTNWVEIHPFVTEHDLQAVRAKIALIRKRALNTAAADTLRSVFNPTLTLIDLDATTPASAIAQLGDVMVRHGLVDEDFVNACLEREARSTTDFTAAVAFPHAFNPAGSRTHVAMGFLKTSVNWGGQSVRIVVLSAFGPHNTRSRSPRLDEIVDCFRDVDRMKSVVNSLIDDAALGQILVTRLANI